MKAQITFETLLLFGVGVGFILIALSTIVLVSDAQKDLYSANNVKNSLYAIARTADEICALGEGNSRQIPLAESFELKTGEDSRGLVASKENVEVVAQTKCQIRILHPHFEKTAYLWYENLEVLVSTNPKE